MNSDKVHKKPGPKPKGRKTTPIERYHNARRKYHMDIDWRINVMLKNAQNRSVKQEKSFNIGKEYLRKIWDDQEGKCALTGTEFDLSIEEGSRPNLNGPSLDKVVPELGYIKGNVRFITYQANWCRSDYGDEALIEFAKKLIEYQEGIIR